MKDSTATPLIISGHPHILKNPKRILKTRGGRMFIGSPKNYPEMKKAAAQLSLQWKGAPLDFPISLKILSYGAWKRDSGNLPDASNLYEFPQDAMQRAGILADDRIVEHHDGSRRISLCDSCARRETIKKGPRKGHKKENCGSVRSCPFERVEIYITDERDEKPGGEAQG